MKPTYSRCVSCRVSCVVRAVLWCVVCTVANPVSRVVSLKVVSSWLTVAVNSETGLPAIETTNEVTNPCKTRHHCPSRSRACWPYHIIGVCQSVAFAVHAVRSRGTSLRELLPRPRNARTVRHYPRTEQVSVTRHVLLTLTTPLSPTRRSVQLARGEGLQRVHQNPDHGSRERAYRL